MAGLFDPPAGWEKILDPATGKKFYYHGATGTRQWDLPLLGTTANPKPPVLPPGWISKVDPATGKTFFVDTATGVRQWEQPPPPVTYQAPRGAPPADGEAKKKECKLQ